MKALGMIEVYGFTTAIVVADLVAKTADVKVIAIDKNKPAQAERCRVPLVMVVKFEGDASSVESALAAGVAAAKQRDLYITSRLIAGFSEEAEWFSHLNALGKDKLKQ
ncbi:MAG: BMC domain-containing protein [Eubacteriales bacterium]